MSQMAINKEDENRPILYSFFKINKLILFEINLVSSSIVIVFLFKSLVFMTIAYRYNLRFSL